MLAFGSGSLMQLHDVHQGVHRRKLRKRVGRGSGRATVRPRPRGTRATPRQGFKLNPIFEGGQMPLARRVPKRGFFNGAFKKEYAIVNLGDIDASFDSGTIVDEAALAARGWSRAMISTGSRSWATAR